MPMLDAIATFLETAGHGTVKTSANEPTTWPIYKGGVVPGKTQELIYLAVGPGAPPLDQMGSGAGSVVAVNPRLVVQVRHSDPSAAMTKAEAIWGSLHKKGTSTLSNVRYLLIMALGVPAPTGRDESGRWIVGCNYQVTKERG